MTSDRNHQNTPTRAATSSTDGPFKTYISLAVEEYRTLRDESKQASVNMWTAMQWGGALIGVTIGVGLSQWEKASPVTPLALDVVVPIFSTLVMIFWLGEAARFKRVGDYLCLIEQKLSLLLEDSGSIPEILYTQWPVDQRRAELAMRLRRTDSNDLNELLIIDPLSWEQWLRKRKGRSTIDGHLEKLYAMRLGFFLILAFGSLLFGWIYKDNGGGSNLSEGWHAAALYLGAVICAIAFAIAIAVGLQLRQKQDIDRQSRDRSRTPA